MMKTASGCAWELNFSTSGELNKDKSSKLTIELLPYVCQLMDKIKLIQMYSIQNCIIEPNKSLQVFVNLRSAPSGPQSPNRRKAGSK
jgi:hypothetical protein